MTRYRKGKRIGRKKQHVTTNRLYNRHQLHPPLLSSDVKKTFILQTSFLLDSNKSKEMCAPIFNFSFVAPTEKGAVLCCACGCSCLL